MSKVKRFIAFGNRNVKRWKGAQALQAQTRLDQSGVKWKGDKPHVTTGRKMNARQRRKYKAWGFIAAKHSMP